MKHTLQTLVICLFALALQVAKAQPGHNDPTFNPNDLGVSVDNGIVYSVARQSS